MWRRKPKRKLSIYSGVVLSSMADLTGNWMSWWTVTLNGWTSKSRFSQKHVLRCKSLYKPAISLPNVSFDGESCVESECYLKPAYLNAETIIDIFSRNSIGFLDELCRHAYDRPDDILQMWLHLWALQINLIFSAIFQAVLRCSVHRYQSRFKITGL